ncbi:heavy-metal-associated domain-containing protein [Sphingobacterium sp. SYP-B4668]|uniref:heavy-metal-associated domain-containing protein n=1 Tax=Sphingobacterium sp. SYP-B4668 TaxID=2996035 RepID=UPI0022DD54C5|nr:heavy-metal-associated domain-containing protein [Sphingobacterium sp. SYP-B4668]
MKNLQWSIPDMQSAHCQARVNAAIQGIEGVKVEKLEAGMLSFSVEKEDVKTALQDAIEKAGYQVGGDSEKASSCSTGCCG